MELDSRDQVHLLPVEREELHVVGDSTVVELPEERMLEVDLRTVSFVASSFHTHQVRLRVLVVHCDAAGW